MPLKHTYVAERVFSRPFAVPGDQSPPSQWEAGYSSRVTNHQLKITAHKIHIPAIRDQDAGSLIHRSKVGSRVVGPKAMLASAVFAGHS
jgi:hypothetical protein